LAIAKKLIYSHIKINVMNELKSYLQNPSRNYQDGIELFKKFGGKINEINYLTNSVSWPFLLKKLQNIYRIGVQNGKIEDQIPIQIKNKPIIVPRKHFDEVESEFTPLGQTKLLTNKLLSRDWSELDQKEKAYFDNNRGIFDYKKSLLIANSKIESELKSTHASLFHAQNDEERQEISEKMVNLKKQQAANWSEIDNFDLLEVERSLKHDESAHIDKAELILRRNNLRARISKLQKQLRNSDDPKHAKKLKDLELAKSDLVEIESKL
jgi:hypothetical protein